MGSAGEMSPDLVRRGGKWVNARTGRILQTNLGTDVKMWGTPMSHTRAQTPRSVDHGVQLANQVSSWPTPVCTDAASAGRHTTTAEASHSGTSLTDAIRLWPTPRALSGGPESAERKKELGRTTSGGRDLQAEAQNWSRPCSTSSDGPTPEMPLWRTPTAAPELGYDEAELMAKDGAPAAIGQRGYRIRPDNSVMNSSIDLSVQSRMWATPRTGGQGSPDNSRPNGQGGLCLGQQAREAWPTPMSRDHRSATPDGSARANRKQAQSRWPDLNDAAANWPTPTTAPEAPNTGSNQVNGPTSLLEGALDVLGSQRDGPLDRPTSEGGANSSSETPDSPPRSKMRLNPTFVEWLMGFPRGHTDPDRW